MAHDDKKSKALELAIAQVDRQFGKGSIMRLGADAPSWTAIQQPCGLFAVKVSDGSLAGVFWCADHGDVSHVYREDELADFDRSAWAGDSWDGLSSQDNEACLRNPVFVALRHI